MTLNLNKPLEEALAEEMSLPIREPQYEYSVVMMHKGVWKSASVYAEDWVDLEEAIEWKENVDDIFRGRDPEDYASKLMRRRVAGPAEDFELE